jgi:hypothetical protein
MKVKTEEMDKNEGTFISLRAISKPSGTPPKAKFCEKYKKRERERESKRERERESV